MCQQEKQALFALLEAVVLAEPEGYIRRFVDEGAAMATLLSSLREQQRVYGPTPYLDTVLAAFPRQSKVRKRQSRQTKQRTIA
jgi:LuxR family maltose regulon positive regulatory protein